MRILFLHHTFPGPFRQLAARLGGLPGNEIVFLSERSRRDVWIPGVRNLTVSGVQPVMAKDRAERELLQMMRYGSRFANALLKLQQGGFEPDIVYAHPRWGCSFFAQDIFPQAFHAVYAEWYYTKGANYTFFTQGAARPAVEFARAASVTSASSMPLRNAIWWSRPRAGKKSSTRSRLHNIFT